MSSSRLPRVWKSCPVATNSSSHHPTPTPSATRPDESTAAVPTCFATVMRSRAGAMYTPVVNSTCSVTAAMAEMRHHESGQSVSGSQWSPNPGAPSSRVEYV